jgi:hypothetical protein
VERGAWKLPGEKEGNEKIVIAYYNIPQKGVVPARR